MYPISWVGLSGGILGSVASHAQVVDSVSLQVPQSTSAAPTPLPGILSTLLPYLLWNLIMGWVGRSDGMETCHQNT
jgi:cell division protein FtsX